MPQLRLISSPIKTLAVFSWILCLLFPGLAAAKE